MESFQDPHRIPLDVSPAFEWHCFSTPGGEQLVALAGNCDSVANRERVIECHVRANGRETVRAFAVKLKKKLTNKIQMNESLNEKVHMGKIPHKFVRTQLQ